MPRHIRPDRLSKALQNLDRWCASVSRQRATHLLPFLALLERGAGLPTGTPVLMSEKPHEYSFWDRYFRFQDDNTAKPYFNPITLRRAETNFPHSNAATIRKNTFATKWQAASWTTGSTGEQWLLAADYVEIFCAKVLTKAGRLTRVPVLDIAILMFRTVEFNDDASAETLEALFRDTFPQRDEDYSRIFVYRAELSSTVFLSRPTPPDYDAAIKSILQEQINTPSITGQPSSQSDLPLDPSDPVLAEVRRLLAFGTSGIILEGVPGSGKTYYAFRMAHHLVADGNNDIFAVQFHPSYGYEDFVEGYLPDDKSRSGYRIVSKTFVLACDRARQLDKDRLVVLIIDEINRGDPSRIFGELLTYIENSYRDRTVILPFSGARFSVPRNLLVIGTMNPFDRSITQIDAAFVRRFDHISVYPSREIVEELLRREGGLTETQVGKIGNWFEELQGMIPTGIGHAFFVGVGSVDDLQLAWKYRMYPSAAYQLDAVGKDPSHVRESFVALVDRLNEPDSSE